MNYSHLAYAISKTIGFCIIVWATIKVSEYITEVTSKDTLIFVIIFTITIREYNKGKKAR